MSCKHGEHDSCIGCNNYLYGGHCGISMEAECREGGGFELYKPKEEVGRDG